MALGEVILGGIVSGMAGAATEKLIEANEENIKQTFNAVNDAVDEGWERDRNAGGISSLGSAPETANA